jgi:RimJ/RimL family protein N-acetyltransferase
MNADPEVMRHFPGTVGRADSDAIIERWAGDFAARGWAPWAAELKHGGGFVGLIGLAIPRHALPFSPCVEVLWRLARAHWGRGYATEGAQAALQVGFGPLGLREIVSYTVPGNLRSRAVMERIGMRDAGEDFDHPALPEGHPLRRHCLYRVAVSAT